MDSGTLTFYNFVAGWYAVKKETLSYASRPNYEAIINKHIVPIFGHRYMRSITAQKIRPRLDSQKGKSKSHPYCKMPHGCAHDFSGRLMQTA
ncbi:MAG: N-terminal phage integrase SAM-like domain-containing protein [Christensenellales bacterium]|jgi:hypothetical protein